MNGSRAAESMVGHDVLLDWNATATKPRDVVSVVLSWADGAGTRESKNVVDVRTLAAGESLVLGESADAGLVLPAAVLGTDRFEVFTSTKDVASVSVPGTANAFVDGVPTLETEIALRPGHSVDLMIGSFVLHLERGTQGRTPTATLADVLADIGMPGFATSATLHVALLATFAFFLPRLGADDVEELGRDQILLMQKLLNASAEADRERTESTAEAGADVRDGSPNSGGAASRGDSGKMGREQPVERSGHWTQAGDARPSDVTLSRERVIHEVRTEGMIGLLASMAIADPNGPVVPFGTIPNGADKTSNSGDFWSPDPGGAFGVGAGLSGTGEGGGGRADGIGVNDVGDLGKSLSRRNGPGDPGGLGGRHGSLASMPGHTVKSPSMHFDPNVSVTGRLPAEVIQRIVRLSQGRYIACYQSGLRSNPSLEGRVAVRFLISKDGDVAVARDAGSDLPDANVRACIVRAFESLSFPNPEGGGSVSVTYPLVFSPSS
ncbi:MAG: AgmX/PglI C-terminal domain-containing protein [Polyangiaceae bacterium]